MRPSSPGAAVVQGQEWGRAGVCDSAGWDPGSLEEGEQASVPAGRTLFPWS